MSAGLFNQIKHALKALKPAEVRAEAERDVRIGLIASSAEVLGEMESFLAPRHLSPQRRAEAVRSLLRGERNGTDIVLCESSLLAPPGAFPFEVTDPESCVQPILMAHSELMLPLARRFYPFRKQVSYKIVRAVARENALFC